ncbi:hypothetical protein, partial [Propionibacterium freudenreichii]|uniref:hypothetical protein n=1 Tax=Propionibacterium freudenreichii TaxID=1744 RepID=UPI003D756CC1
PERLMREPTDHRVARGALASTLAAPPVRLHDTALDHRPIRVQTLPDSLQAELVETAERGQARCSESRVGTAEGLVDSKTA